MTTESQRRLSIWCIYFTTFYDTAAFAIFLPSLQPYLETLGKGVWFAGLVIAAFNVAGIVSSPLLGFWSSKRTLKEALVFTNLVSFGGNCLYYFVHDPYVVLVARVLVGLAAGSSVICQTYVSLVSSPEERTGAMAKWMTASVVGFTGGSALSSVLALDKINVHSIGLTIYTAPAMFSGLLALIGLVWSLLLFTEPQKPALPDPKPIQEPSTQIHRETPYRVLVVWLAVIFVVNCVWTSFEVLNTPTMMDVFGWSIQEIGLLWIANGVITAFIAFTMQPIQQKLTEKGLFFLYWSCLTCSPILIIHYTSHRYLSQYILGFVLMACGFVSNTIISSSIFSQWVSFGHPGNWMAAFQVSSRLAQIIGAAVSGEVYDTWGSNAVYIPLTILCIFLMTIICCFHKWVFPNKHQEEQQPLLSN